MFQVLATPSIQITRCVYGNNEPQKRAFLCLSNYLGNAPRRGINTRLESIDNQRINHPGVELGQDTPIVSVLNMEGMLMVVLRPLLTYPSRAKFPVFLIEIA